MSNNLNLIYQQLLDKPYRFSFTQACFLLESVENQKFNCVLASEQPFKLTAYVHAGTLSASCVKFDLNRKNFILNIPALLGFNGFLPKCYTEQVFFGEKQKQFLLSDFINIFQHRFFSLKYSLEKNFCNTLNNQPFSEVFDICGISDPCVKAKANPFLALLLMKSKTTKNLQTILECLLNMDVEILEFQEQIFEIPVQHQLKLDFSALSQKAIGSKTKTYNSIAIVLLFKSFKEYMNYLKDEKKQKEITSIVKYFFNNEMNFSFKLKIKEKTTKTFKLNLKNQLGITTWI